MPQSSLSPVMMAVITTNLFLILLTLFLCYSKLMLQAGYKLLALFAAFVFLRFLLPIEFSFAQNIHLPLSVSKVLAVFYGKELFVLGDTSVTLWLIFRWVWAIGFVIGLARYALSYFRARSYMTLYGKVITRQEPYASILDCVCQEQGKKNRFTVLEMPGLLSPVLFGVFAPRILMPEHITLSKEDLYFVFRHETAHHYHHDLLLKNLIKLITLVYWWDSFCLLLNRQVGIILEMRIDKSVAKTNGDSTYRYLQCILNVSAAAAAAQAPLPQDFTLSLFPRVRSSAWRRFALLTQNEKSKKNWGWNLALGLAVAFVFVLSYTFVPESYCNPTDEIPFAPAAEENLRFFTEENSYSVDNGDGTYDIYYNGLYFETTDSLEYFPEEMPMRTKADRPE